MSPERGKAFDAAFAVAPNAELIAALDRIETLCAGKSALIYFEDSEVLPEVFDDVGAAKKRFEQFSQSWNCHLFVEDAGAHATLPALAKALREALPILEGPATDCMCYLETRKPCRGCRIRSALAELAEALR